MSKKIPKQSKYFAHSTATIEKDVVIGDGTKIWADAHVRAGSKIGQSCIIAEGVFIDADSIIGNNVKIQNHAIIYHQAIIADGVFIGPKVCFTNDKQPRAINPDGTLKSADDWEVATIKIGYGSAIGAHSVITPGVTIGEWAMAGSGSVITKDVPDYALVFGNPARIHGFVCKCGKKLENIIKKDITDVIFACECGEAINIKRENYKLLTNQEPKKRIWLR